MNTTDKLTAPPVTVRSDTSVREIALLPLPAKEIAMYSIADALAGANAKQFPGKFS
ncbi:MAG: hypothetical protein HY661_14670 [Betaproteobacteria bacterium]|nr:hypothetical protein [Betaproteobacteria bacterium]